MLWSLNTWVLLVIGHPSGFLSAEVGHLIIAPASVLGFAVDGCGLRMCLLGTRTGNGTKDSNLLSPGGLILTHSHIFYAYGVQSFEGAVSLGSGTAFTAFRF